MQFQRYTYSNPHTLPVERDEDGGWVGAEPDDWNATVSAAGFDPDDDEVAVGTLAEAWNGHPAGSIVVTGLTVSGHPFAVQVP